MRLFLIFCLSGLITSTLFSQLVINEFSSSNTSGIKDEDSETVDWIELYNNSSSPINLDGCHLSDDAAFASKWTFPAVEIKPWSFLVVFASGKNRTALPLSFQTIINKGDNWKYLVPGSNIGNSWQVGGFDDSSWKTGRSGFGYSDNDDETLILNIVSVFVRKEFTVTNLQEIEELILSIDYDDGFVAFINGHEIARSNLGLAGTPVAFNEVTGSNLREATMYSGGLPENFHISGLDSILVEGVNVLAIQGHNSGTSSSDLSLIPMLTLGLKGSAYTDNHPDYIKLTGRQLHTNFKISSQGETIILSDPDSALLDSVSAISLLSDISYGRKPNGGDTWFYFNTPTPGTSNETQGYNEVSGDTVKFSFMGGYFPGGLEVQLSSSDPADTIVYTLNGSAPTLNDKIYTQPILVSTNTIIRARALNFRKLPGIVTTNTYFTKKHTLPVVCISTDSSNLWDFYSGIYVMGPNASPDSPFFGANFWQDWEKRAHLELYDVDGNKQLDQDIGIKINGNYSRANPQKSLTLFARAEYGKGSFEYKVFKDKPIEKFESLLLRNGGNDWYQAIFRDGFTSTLVRDMDVDRLAFQPSIVYINGEYWGIMNIREKINENYLANNHPVNPENINLLEGNGTPVQGFNASYLQMINYLNTHTLQAEQDYLQVSDKIDINNYIQYQLAQIFINNKDWPGNNIKFWNTNDPGSLWRWILFDTDFGFSIWEEYAASYNTLKFALDPAFPDGWPNPPWSTLLFRRMVSNPGFRNEFANQYADRLNTNFAYARTLVVLDSIKQLYLPEINDHIIRWGLYYENWLNNIATIKTFLAARPNYARTHMQSELGLGAKALVKILINTPGAGQVKINSIVPDIYPFTGSYFSGLPVKLTAVPAAGYRFLRWEGNINSFETSIDYNMSVDGIFTAVFEPVGIDEINIVINEFNYSSSPEKDTKDWIELYNAGKGTVNLKNWIISDAGPEVGFSITSDLMILPGCYAVVCRELAAFRMILPNIANVTGDLNFGLSSTGDDINLFNPDSVLVDWVNYAPNLPWPIDANGTGASLELIDPSVDNNMASNWKSSPNGGTPGSLNYKTLILDVKREILVSTLTLDCFPNPFSDYTTIRISSPGNGNYRLELYDLQGRLLKSMADQDLNAGAYYIDWDGRDQNNEMLPGGVYIFRLTGEKQSINLKVVKL